MVISGPRLIFSLDHKLLEGSASLTFQSSPDVSGTRQRLLGCLQWFVGEGQSLQKRTALLGAVRREQWGGTLWDNTHWQCLPPSWALQYIPLGKPSCEGAWLRVGGGRVEDSWRGLHTQQGAQSWHQKTWFCIWLPEGSSCGRGGRRVGIQWREDHLGLTSVLYTWVAGGV